jgi:YVTN family beta-propeller protein
LAAGLLACGGLKEQHSDLPTISPHQGYPYYLVIGGGLSETLSVLRVNQGPSFKLYNDVALTGAAIHQTLVRNNTYFAMCSLSNSIAVYDFNLNVEREVSVGGGTNPIGFTMVDDRTAWVSDFVSADVRLVDLGPGVADDQRVKKIIALPDGSTLPHDDGVTQSWARPNGIALAHGRLFVALSNLSAQYVPAGPGVLAVINPTSGAVEKMITLSGRDAIGVTYDDARDLVWVTTAGDYVVGEGFVGNGMIEAVNPQTLAIERRIDVDGAPFEIVLASGALAYLGNGMDARVPVVDLDAGEQTDAVDLREHGETLSFISGLALDPDGRLYVVDFDSDQLYVLDPANEYKVIASFTVNDGPDTLSFLM